MLARRHMLGTTLFGGFLGATMPASDQNAQTPDRQMMEVVDALKEIKKSLDSPQASRRLPESGRSRWTI